MGHVARVGKKGTEYRGLVVKH